MDTTLARLHGPMDRNQLIEVMLRHINSIQLFLLFYPEPNQELPDLMLIEFCLIQHKKTRMYTNLIES